MKLETVEVTPGQTGGTILVRVPRITRPDDTKTHEDINTVVEEIVTENAIVQHIMHNNGTIIISCIREVDTSCADFRRAIMMLGHKLNNEIARIIGVVNTDSTSQSSHKKLVKSGAPNHSKGYRR